VIGTVDEEGICAVACACVVAWCIFCRQQVAIRHETLNLFDVARHAARRRGSCCASRLRDESGFRLLEVPVAIISNGNTVRNTALFIPANVLAARKDILVASVQQDLPTDPPLMTKIGLPYVGRLQVYERGEAIIFSSCLAIERIEPNADYSLLTLVGHSNGGDISMFCAKRHPELVSKVITPIIARSVRARPQLKILSYPIKGPEFQDRPGVLPTRSRPRRRLSIFVNTKFQHYR